MKIKLYNLLLLSFFVIPLSNAQLVGYTNVQAIVGENGQSTASINISTPKGTFIQPDISLTYSSHNPNSFCGIGFSIDGIFQAITRVPATLEQDGFTDGRSNDPNAGRYALNGERLMATFNYSNNINSTAVSDCYLYNSVQANNSSNGAFRTEQESFSKILVYSSGKIVDLGDPRYYADSFRVFTKDGLILEFGFTPDSRTEKNSTPLTTAWLLNKISDRNGNYLEIKYLKNAANNENYPSEIFYTGNVSKNLLPYAKVSFLYENRPDSINRYQNGARVKLTKRLKSILSFEHSNLFRRYDLTYLNDTASSKISSVKEFGTDNNSFLKPVNFLWKQQPPTPAFTKNGSGIWSGHAGGSTNNIIGDFDGNGLMDMAGHAGNGLWHISLSTAFGCVNSFWQAPLNTAFNKFLGDFNGDGKADLTGLRNGRWQVGLSNGHGFVNSDWSGSFTAPLAGYVASYVVDVNGDGLSDILSYGGSGNWHQFISNGSSFTHFTYNDGCTTCNGQLLIGDFNADGKSDVINAPFLTSLNGSTIANSFVADMNGDGISDIVSFAGNSQWKVSLSTGFNNIFTTTTWLAHNNGIGNNVVGDFNKDGMEDIATHLAGGTPNWRVYLSTGKGFVNAGIWPGHSGEIGNNYVADFDGDGASDLVGYTGLPGLWHVAISNAENDLIGSVQNGNGVTYAFDYSTITNKNIYQKDSTGVYPNIDFTSPLVVTSSLKTDDGVSGMRTIYYKYGNAKFNLRGRGFRGFERLAITDSLSNSISTTWYNTDDKCVGARVIKSEVRTLNNIILAKSENTIKIDKIIFIKDSVCFSYYSKVIDSSFDINGGYFTSKKTEYTFDNFENPKQTIETNADGYSLTTNNTFLNQTNGDWILGRLTESVVIKQRPGKPTVTKNATFGYNAKGFLIQETILPSDSRLRLQTDYELDTFGNRIKKTISGPGITARSDYFFFNSDGNLLLKAQNELGYATRTTYKNQLPDSSISLNGLVTIVSRDAFGREVLIRNPDNTTKTITYFNCGAGINYCPVGSVFAIKEETTGRATKYSFFDKLDRPIRSVSESFNNNPVIIADKIFNPDGTVKRQSEPYFNGNPILWTDFDYDAVKRLLKKTEPGSRISQVSYTGFTTVTTNEQGQKFTRIVNAQGKLIKTIDNDNAALAFDYDSDNNLVETNDPNGNKIKNSYDLRSNKISMSDPDMGNYTYEYNTLGQLIKETNPAETSSSYEYDLLGRKIRRTEPEGITEWKFDPPNALGNIQQVLFDGKPKQGFTYDALTRVTKVDYYVKATRKSYKYNYNSVTGILSAVTYPNDAAIQYERTANGYLNKIIGSNIKTTPVILWTAGSYNQYNELTSWRLGNNLITSRKFDPITNVLTEIKSGTASYPDSIQNLKFSYSTVGNLLMRTDDNFALKENFTYDGLNRLTQSNVLIANAPTANNMSLRYDKLGNISFKSDVGSYLYGENGKGPHTLTSIDNSTATNCAYNFNQKISYTSYDYVSTVTNNNTEIAYTYGPNRNRETMVVKKNGLFVQIKNYYGDLFEEVIDRFGDTSYNYQIKNGSDVIAIVEGSKKIGLYKDSINYILQDNLGSVYAITNETGKVKERVSYDAWGKPRNPYNWETYSSTPKLTSFERGYTFHEMMDIDFLICMNARVYNPVLGRFLSPDPYIQSPENLQSHNRFSYVLNNPLANTDPTGYFKLGKFLKKWLPTIVGVAITLYTGGFGNLALGKAILSGAASGFGSAFTGGIINGQSLGASFKLGLQGAESGALGAFLNNGIANSGLKDFAQNPIQGEIKALLYGGSAGTVSTIAGGSFKNGFINGFINQNIKYLRDGFVQWKAGREGNLSPEQLERTKATYRTANDYSEEGFEEYWKKADNGFYVGKTDEITIQDPDFPNVGKFPTSNPYIYNENSEFMMFLAKKVPGFNSFAVSHDYFATAVFNKNLGLFNEVISIGTIPLFINLQYRALQFPFPLKR